MKTTLLTGVTGLIGRHVLYELLHDAIDSGSDDRIFVTIRATDASCRSGAQTAEERLTALLQRGALPDYLTGYPRERLLEHVTLLEVDLLDEDLGNVVRDRMPEGFCVVHSAASTNLAPSDPAAEEVEANIVEATRHLLEAVAGRAAKVVYIGTSFAAGPVAGTIDDDYFSLEPAGARNHYERAKLQTERALAEFCDEHGMDWQILRPSVVCGRLHDAPLHYMSKFDVFYGFGKFFDRLATAGCRETVRIWSHAESMINIVPVDFVAKAIVRGMAEPVRQLNIVHPRSVPARALIEKTLRAANFETFELVDEMPEDLNEVERLYYGTAGAIFTSYVTSPAQRYDTRRLEALMGGLMPPAMAAELDALLDYAVACEWRSVNCAATAARRAEERAPKRVVFVGSGYLSFYAYRKLERRLRRELAAGAVEVVAVSSSNYHVFHGFVGEVVAGVLPLETAFAPSQRLFSQASFVQGAVDRVDLDANMIHFTNSAGEQAELRYDELVLGTGSVNATDGVPGLERYGQSVRSFRTLRHLQQHLVEMLERAETTRDAEEARNCLTFCVAGGGLTGIEMGAAIAQYLRECAGNYTVLDHIHPRVVVAHSGEEILPEIQHKFGRLVRYARRQLDGHGIELRLEARIAQVTPDRVVFEDGSALKTRSVITTVGHRPVVMPGTEGCPFDDQRRLVADRNLNLCGRDNVWIGGDCASVRQPLRKSPCPPNALWAIKHGQHIGRNLARKLRGRRLRPFKFVGLGQAASLGDRKGIAELYGLQITGALAKAIRLGFFLYYMPNKRNAAQVLVEFSLRGLFRSRVLVAREIEPVSPHRDVAARRNAELYGW